MLINYVFIDVATEQEVELPSNVAVAFTSPGSTSVIADENGDLTIRQYVQLPQDERAATHEASTRPR